MSYAPSYAPSYGSPVYNVAPQLSPRQYTQHAYDAHPRHSTSPSRHYRDAYAPAQRTPSPRGYHPTGYTQPPVAAPMTSPVIVYGHPLSQPCRSVQWYVKYARSNAEIRYIDLLDKKEHKTPEYERKFPSMQVPAAEDNGLYIEESTAILQHIARNDPIMPRDAHGIAKLNTLLARHLSSVRKCSTELFRFVFFSKPDEFAGLISKGQETIAPILKSYNAILEKHPYVGGRDISLADFMFAPEVDGFLYARGALGVDVLGPYPAIKAYLRRLESIPGYVENVRAAADSFDSLAEKGIVPKNPRAASPAGSSRTTPSPRGGSPYNTSPTGRQYTL